MPRSRLLISLTVALAISLAAPAGASTFCVNSPSCVSNGGSDEGSDATALASALTKAQGAAGPDRVEVGAGSYARAGGFAYTGAASNTLDLAGAGSGQTV